MPATGGDPPEVRPGGCLVVKMERLRVVLSGKFQNLFTRHLIAAKSLDSAGLKVLEILHALILV